MKTLNFDKGKFTNIKRDNRERKVQSVLGYNQKVKLSNRYKRDGTTKMEARYNATIEEFSDAKFKF